jgi:hypothetical protein
MHLLHLIEQQLIKLISIYNFIDTFFKEFTSFCLVGYLILILFIVILVQLLQINLFLYSTFCYSNNAFLYHYGIDKCILSHSIYLSV